MGDKRLKGIIRGFKGLQEVTSGYGRFKGVTRSYRGLRGYRGLKGLQEVTRVYKR